MIRDKRIAFNPRMRDFRLKRSRRDYQRDLKGAHMTLFLFFRFFANEIISVIFRRRSRRAHLVFIFRNTGKSYKAEMTVIESEVYCVPISK